MICYLCSLKCKAGLRLESTHTVYVDNIYISQLQLADTCSKALPQLQCKDLRLVKCSSYRLFCRVHNYLVSPPAKRPSSQIGPLTQNELYVRVCLCEGDQALDWRGGINPFHIRSLLPNFEWFLVEEVSSTAPLYSHSTGDQSTTPPPPPPRINGPLSGWLHHTHSGIHPPCEVDFFILFWKD